MDPARRALVASIVAAAAGLARAQQTQRLMTKPIPKSGEALPVIGLGTWQTFDVGADKAARAPLAEVLGLFAAAGGAVVDSSPMYGSSESVAGELVAGQRLRERLFIATKVWTSGRDAGVRQMEQSFQRLRVRTMDLMQIHNLVDAGTHTKTLLDWKAKGRIRYAGITHYSASAHGEVERWLKAHDYDFLQINYSLAEPQAEQRLLPLAEERKVAVLANRPFAEGSLFRSVRGKPLPPWAEELGIASWAQYFLKWIVSHPAVTCAIPATANPKHVRDNLAAGKPPLPDADARRRMAEYWRSL